jgi:magnesium-transporting ATPase (P-type)
MKIKARVKRAGKETEIPSEEIVPGDIVLIESRMKVPSDIRLFEVSGLEIDESFLTGESIAAKKQISILQENLGVAQRTNMAFAGATVLKGRGTGVVVSTGTDTQVGKISQDVMESASAKPPLVQRMEKFIKQISIFFRTEYCFSCYFTAPRHGYDRYLLFCGRLGSSSNTRR